MVKLIALVLPLGVDKFAVAAALGMTGLPTGQRVRDTTLQVDDKRGELLDIELPEQPQRSTR